MNNKLKMLIEKIVEIMKEEGIRYIGINKEGKWNRDKNEWEDSDDYQVHMDYNRRIHK